MQNNVNGIKLHHLLSQLLVCVAQRDMSECCWDGYLSRPPCSCSYSPELYRTYMRRSRRFNSCVYPKVKVTYKTCYLYLKRIPLLSSKPKRWAVADGSQSSRSWWSAASWATETSSRNLNTSSRLQYDTKLTVAVLCHQFKNHNMGHL